VESSFSFIRWGVAATLLLATTAPWRPAAADTVAVTVVSPAAPAERRFLPEVTPAGTVVLRGSRPVAEAPPAALPARGQPPGIRPGAPPPELEGWDRDYDTNGIDRHFDTSGLDRRSDGNYDTSGIDRGAPQR
jgi:hypothetical protein